MGDARCAVAAVAVGGAPQVGVALVEGFDVDEQHGGASWLVGPFHPEGGASSA